MPSASAAARAALLSRFRELAPDVALDDDLRAARLEEVLLPGVAPQDFVADLGDGDGGELKHTVRGTKAERPRAHSVLSSSLLAVNALAPFKARPGDLRLPIDGPFEGLRFERKLPVGVPRADANLDALATGPDGLVGVESKLTEHLSTKRVKWSDSAREAYGALAASLPGDPWAGVLAELLRAPPPPGPLDVAQLVKHALALGLAAGEGTATLLYLCWEPTNPDAAPRLAKHREAVAALSARTAGARVRLVAASWPEVWALWDDGPADAHAAAHAAALRARYAVAI